MKAILGVVLLAWAVAGVVHADGPAQPGSPTASERNEAQLQFVEQKTALVLSGNEHMAKGVSEMAPNLRKFACDASRGSAAGLQKRIDEIRKTAKELAGRQSELTVEQRERLSAVTPKVEQLTTAIQGC